MSCGVGRRRGSDPVLLWLWCRLAATVPIRPLGWEPPYAMRAAPEKTKTRKKEKEKKKRENETVKHYQVLVVIIKKTSHVTGVFSVALVPSFSSV